MLIDELRGGWLGVPRAYTLLDFLGVALGAWFIYAGTSRDAPAWPSAVLGGIMMYIHAQRFFYAPQTRAGLVRLASALNLSPADMVAVAAELHAKENPLRLPAAGQTSAR